MTCQPLPVEIPQVTLGSRCENVQVRVPCVRWAGALHTRPGTAVGQAADRVLCAFPAAWTSCREALCEDRVGGGQKTGRGRQCRSRLNDGRARQCLQRARTGSAEEEVAWVTFRAGCRGTRLWGTFLECAPFPSLHPWPRGGFFERGRSFIPAALVVFDARCSQASAVSGGAPWGVPTARTGSRVQREPRGAGTHMHEQTSLCCVVNWGL